jgi:hypothetical protein
MLATTRPALVTSSCKGETWELNVWATTDDLWKLADIETTDWSQRRLLAVGRCARAPVWWHEEDGTVYIISADRHPMRGYR